MIAFHVHVAARAHRHPAASAFYWQLCALAEFHHVHAHIGGSVQLVHLALAVGNAYANRVVHGLTFKSVHPVHGGVLQN